VAASAATARCRAIRISVDIDSLRRRFPEIGWRRFRDWAAGQDWSRIDSARL